MDKSIIKQAEEYMQKYPGICKNLALNDIISGLLKDVNRLTEVLRERTDIIGDWNEKCNKLVAENAALKEEVKKLKNNNQWYVDYANDKDKDVCKWIGEANKLEAENVALKQEVETNDEVIDAMQEERDNLKLELNAVIKERDELKKLNHKRKENNTMLNLFVKDQDHTIETKCDEIESLRDTAAQLARAVITGHRYTIARPAQDTLEYHPVCQCVDCKLAREVLK